MQRSYSEIGPFLHSVIREDFTDSYQFDFPQALISKSVDINIIFLVRVILALYENVIRIRIVTKV